MTEDRRAHVGRQPIYDRDGAVVGYELLFRADTGAVSASRIDEYATARVLVAAFTEFGLEELTGGRVGFLNMTREFLTGKLPLPFDNSQAVLEVPANTEVDEELLAGVTVLGERGYTIALDGFRCGGGQDTLLPLATYAKLDMLDPDEGVLRDAVTRCRQHKHLHLIAQRLESTDALRLAFDLGFDLFQGHILGRPHVSSTVALAPARLARLRVLAALSVDDVDLDEVVTMVSQDAGLSMRLLRATNAASFGLTRTVSSVREALVAMGLNRLRQWVTLMLVADLTSADQEQLSQMLVRARLCQLLADDAHGVPGEIAYIGGLLSAVADLFGEPVDRIVAGLPLDDALVAALTDGSGPLGEVLTVARDYTSGEAPSPERPGLVESYLAALRWTTTVTRELAAELPARGPL
ncbi:EAL and HDOD domain-containing protein [Dactylosporangium sucinum]|uniref:Diguanylate cyclase n=1 Tax=Dactylosporangium sucinum TaxID=1424081 RepID=A0A917X2F1_9ACTN|nr:HDOD domain-containing protein [Dactylosporangium sucinum]GGM61719.1 diguanylate cyclase [Dactylosporangium sucinum]